MSQPGAALAQQPQEGELLPLSEAQPASAIVEYTQTEAALADLRGRLKNVVFDVKTTAGDKAARAARKELVTLRTSLEEKRLELNAEDQERIRGRNAKAKRIAAEIEALEQPLDKQIREEEQRKANEKRLREEAEAKRVVIIQERIEAIRETVIEAAGKSVDEIVALIGTVEATAVDETFAEFRQQAEGAKASTLVRLRMAYAAAEKLEAEQKRLAAERAELARQKAAEEVRAAQERERIAEEQRQARKAAEAEAARQVEVLRLQREEQEAENARIRAQQEAAAAQERARIEEENRQARLKRQDDEHAHQQALRRQREEEERKAAERRRAIAKEENLLAAQKAAQQATEREQREAREAEERRLADARAELERQQEALRLAREAVTKPTDPVEAMPSEDVQPVATSAPAEAAERPSDEEIIEVVAQAFFVSEETARGWILEMAVREAEAA